MKKYTKYLLRALPVFLFMFVLVGGSVFGITAGSPATGSGISQITSLAGSVWTTLATVLQILAFVAIIVAGIRYMFASADTKADIKQQTIILVVGAVLVFAAVPIAQWLSSVAGQVFAS